MRRPPQPPPTGLVSTLEKRYADLCAQADLAEFRRRGGRFFVAAENRTVEEIQCLLDLGHRHFAVKYVQQAAAWSHPNLAPWRSQVTLHLYGHLQRNKLSRALALGDALESVDRAALLHALRLRLTPDAPCQRLRHLCLQVNVGREPQKTGVHPEDAETLLDLARALALPVTGVMAIPPRREDPRLHFRWLRAFADRHALAEVHMGMSDDFPCAIRAGATAIRIGRRLFGENP